MSNHTAASSVHEFSLALTPFCFFRDLPTAQVYDLLAGESPQIKALVLCHLEAAQARIVMEALPDRDEVRSRIGHMREVAPEIIREVERVFERMSALPPLTGKRLGGQDFLRQMEEQSCQNF